MISGGAGWTLIWLGSCSPSFFFSSRRRHTRLQGDWSSDVCSSDLTFRADTLQSTVQSRQATLESCEVEVEHVEIIRERPLERAETIAFREEAVLHGCNAAAKVGDHELEIGEAVQNSSGNEARGGNGEIYFAT